MIKKIFQHTLMVFILISIIFLDSYFRVYHSFNLAWAIIGAILGLNWVNIHRYLFNVKK